MRAAAVPALAKFAARLPSLAPSVRVLLKRSLLDEDDEVSHVTLLLCCFSAPIQVTIHRIVRDMCIDPRSSWYMNALALHDMQVIHWVYTPNGHHPTGGGHVGSCLSARLALGVAGLLRSHRYSISSSCPAYSKSLSSDGTCCGRRVSNTWQILN